MGQRGAMGAPAGDTLRPSAWESCSGWGECPEDILPLPSQARDRDPLQEPGGD